MKELRIIELKESIKGKLLKGREDDIISDVAIDSREVNADSVFFAIKGEVNDGHRYIEQVLEKGCRTVVASDETYIQKILSDSEWKEINILKVDDTTEALMLLGKYYLSILKLKKVIAITGSVGKTTTRDLTFAVVSSKYRAAKNLKNYNNQFGIPLSIFKFPTDTEVAVLEMGMDGFGQIETLVNIAKPDIAIITNIGISHIERLGSREGILKAKMEVTSQFDDQSTLIVNGDCDLLNKEMVKGAYKTISIGSDEGEDYVVSDVHDYGDKGIDFTLSDGDCKYQISLPIPGAHNAYNCALAIAAGNRIGIDTKTAMMGLKNASLTEKRLEIIKTGGITIINDSYNASPESMKSGITTLINTEGKRKIAVLGDMFELGAESVNSHLGVGRFAAEKGVDILMTAGDQALNIIDGAETIPYNRKKHYSAKEELTADLKNMLRDGDVVFIKASRAMGFEEIVKELQKEQ